jgi:hypothetical protein
MDLMTFVQDERLRSRLATVLDLSGAAGRAAAGGLPVALFPA